MELFFIVRCEEIHVLVSVGSSLLFGSLCNPLDFLFLLSFASISLLSSLFCNKGRVSIRQNKIPSIDFIEPGTWRADLVKFIRRDLWWFFAFLFRPGFVARGVL
jgi:hypothetical protein